MEKRKKIQPLTKQMEEKIWKKADVDVKGLITNDIAKLLALIMVFVISYMIITFFPQITQNYFGLVVSLGSVVIGPILTLSWIAGIVPGGSFESPWGAIGWLILVILFTIITLYFYFGNYIILLNFAYYAYGIIISLLVLITFITLSSWISLSYRIRRSKTQDFVKYLAESAGIAVGMFFLFFYLPYDIYLPAHILTRYTMVDFTDLNNIFSPFQAMTTALTLVGVETAGHILLRVFLIFFTCYGFVFLSDFVFWSYRKLAKTPLIRGEPIYQYKYK